MLQSVPVGYAVDFPVYHDTIENSSLKYEQLVPYPELTTMPNITPTEPTDQFSYQYDDNEVKIIWTHEAGTRLDYREVPDDNLPDCKEFVYLTQDMHWPVENYPLEKNLTINYEVSFDGSFAEELAAYVFHPIRLERLTEKYNISVFDYMDSV